MRLAIALVAVFATTAHADRLPDPEPTPALTPATAHVRDPDHQIDDAAVLVAMSAPDVASALAKCPTHGGEDLLVWLVFERGKVTSADVGGSNDRKLEACVVRAARLARVGISKARVVASVELVLLLEASATRGGGSGTGIGDLSGARGKGGGDPGGAGSPAALAPEDRARTPSEIARVITARRLQIRACYEAQLKDQPGLAGKLVLHISIAASGEVSGAQARTSLDAKVDECVLNLVKHLRFPGASAPTDVNYPLVFTGQE